MQNGNRDTPVPGGRMAVIRDTKMRSDFPAPFAEFHDRINIVCCKAFILCRPEHHAGLIPDRLDNTMIVVPGIRQPDRIVKAWLPGNITRRVQIHIPPWSLALDQHSASAVGGIDQRTREVEPVRANKIDVGHAAKLVHVILHPAVVLVLAASAVGIGIPLQWLA